MEAFRCNFKYVKTCKSPWNFVAKLNCKCDFIVSVKPVMCRTPLSIWSGTPKMTVAELLGRQSHFLAGRGNMRGLLLATAFILICFLQCAKGWCKTAGQSNINVMKCHIIGSAYFTLNLNAPSCGTCTASFLYNAGAWCTLPCTCSLCWRRWESMSIIVSEKKKNATTIAILSQNHIPSVWHTEAI